MSCSPLLSQNPDRRFPPRSTRGEPGSGSRDARGGPVSGGELSATLMRRLLQAAARARWRPGVVRPNERSGPGGAGGRAAKKECGAKTTRTSTWNNSSDVMENPIGPICCEQRPFTYMMNHPVLRF